MNAVYLTTLIIQLNKVIDSGKHKDITIDQVHISIEKKSLLRFIKEACGKDIDLSLQLSDSSDFEAKYEDRINQIFASYAGQESRKWGVENSGLCLALAWTNEIIQQHFSFPKDPLYQLK